MGVMELDGSSAPPPTRWGPPQPPKFPKLKDFHKMNLRSLRDFAIKKRGGGGATAKEENLAKVNMKKFQHVQSRVKAGRNDNGQVVVVKRLAGMRVHDDAEDDSEDSDDLEHEISIPFDGGDTQRSHCSRFSDVSIKERKDRISDIIKQIYAAVPLSQAEKTPLKKYHSMDRVNEVGGGGNIFSGPVSRPACCGRLDTGLGRSSAALSAVRRFASSPRLAQSIIKKTQPKAAVRTTPPSASKSMINLHHGRSSSVKLRAAGGATLPRSPRRKGSPSKSKRVGSAKSKADGSNVRVVDCRLPSMERDSLSPPNNAKPNGANEEDADVLEPPSADGRKSATNDVGAVKVSSRAPPPSDGRKSATPSLISSKAELPSDYKVGMVPKYLVDRREKWRTEAEAQEQLRKETEGCPPGHVLLTESQRLQVLRKLKSEYSTSCAEMARLPIFGDTLRVRQKRSNFENGLAKLEEGIRTYEKEKVYILREELQSIFGGGGDGFDDRQQQAIL